MIKRPNYLEILDRCCRRRISTGFQKPSRIILLLALIFPVTVLLFTPFTSSPINEWSDKIFDFGFLQGLMMAGVFLLLFLYLPEPTAVGAAEDGRAALDYSQKISQSCENPLQQVIQETEQSALEIISQVKELDCTSLQLVNYLLKADQDTLDMQTRIDQSTAIIDRISDFMQQLPIKIDAERQLMEKIQVVLHLTSEVVETIQDVSRQTNMVALNIIIQSAHLGEEGRGLAVVANEVRRLSGCGNEAVRQITQAVSAIQEPMRSYTGEFQHDFTQDLQEAARVTGSVHELQASYEDMKQYYKTLLTVIRDHNMRMADKIVDTLGNIQYQDIVRQRLERVIAMQERYRDVVRAALDDMTPASSPHFLNNLEQILKDAVEEEQRHSTLSTDGKSGDLRIELF